MTDAAYYTRNHTDNMFRKPKQNRENCGRHINSIERWLIDSLEVLDKVVNQD